MGQVIGFILKLWKSRTLQVVLGTEYTIINVNNANNFPSEKIEAYQEKSEKLNLQSQTNLQEMCLLHSLVTKYCRASGTQ